MYITNISFTANVYLNRENWTTTYDETHFFRFNSESGTHLSGLVLTIKALSLPS